MRILIYGAGVIGGKSMKNEEYKKLSIAEFTKAAGRYESNHAGVYEMCKKDYPDPQAFFDSGKEMPSPKWKIDFAGCDQ